MEDLIPILIIVVIIGAAAFYLIRAKIRGQKCIGCPYAKGCNKKSCYDKDSIKEYYHKQEKENGTQ